jgi:uncharacterized protein involved in exopolysaccharide biosynthesis
VSFVPPQESASSSSAAGLGSLMKDFGLSKIGGKSSQEYTMLVFLQSRSVADSIVKKYDLAEVYDIKTGFDSDVRGAFLDNIKISYLDEGNYELTVWDTDKQRAADIANDYVKITNAIAERTYKEEQDVNVRYLTNRINSIDSTILSISLELSKISNKKHLFSPEEQAKIAGTALAEMKSMALQYEIFYDYYKKNYGADDPQTVNMKEIWETSENKIKEAYTKPGLVGNFALRDITPIAVEYLTKYADIEALTKTKALLTTSLEKSILESKSNVHNFFVIDPAVPADKKDKPKRAFVVAGGTLGGFVLSLFLILLINSLKNSIKQAKQLIN